MKYKVYFQIYGKKMLVNVEADNIEQAKRIVNSALKFDKIKPIDDDDVFYNDKSKSAFYNIMDILMGKK